MKLITYNFCLFLSSLILSSYASTAELTSEHPIERNPASENSAHKVESTPTQEKKAEATETAHTNAPAPQEKRVVPKEENSFYWRQMGGRDFIR